MTKDYVQPLGSYPPYFRTLSRVPATSQFRPIRPKKAKLRLSHAVSFRHDRCCRLSVSTLSVLGGNVNALDSFCNSAGVVVGRPGFELHARWIYSLAARAGADRTRAQPGDWPSHRLGIVIAGHR